MRKLSISGKNNCALLGSGEVVCWGIGGSGAGNPDAGGPIPTKVLGLYQPAEDIASGGSFSAAILEDGQSVLWGRIHQWPVSLSIASPIWPYPGIPMAAHLPIDSSPDCYATVGRDLYCMLTESPNGEPALHPVLMPGPDDVVELATSWGTSCARTSGGDVHCWGSGPVGDGSTEGASAPVHVPGIVGATQIATRGHSAAVLADGTAVCWGVYGLSTACGEPVIPYMEGPLLEPRPIAGLPPVTQVSAGIGHTCALTAEGEVYCLGLNTSDQLGDGTYSTTAVPVKVKLPSHLGG